MAPTPRASEIQQFLPLTHLTFFLLLELADAPGHAYALVQRIRERSDGLVDPGTGSFYSIVRGAVDNGLIVEDESGDSGRRKQFSLTRLGQAVLEAEHRRLAKLVGDARHVVARRSGRA